MKKYKALRMSLLVAAMVVALPLGWALDVYAQGATPGAGAMQQEVRGTIKDVDPSGRMLTLDDGTRLTIPPTVQLPQGIKEGSIVKASFEERAGQKVVTALEVQSP